jgi:hypothetical protein
VFVAGCAEQGVDCHPARSGPHFRRHVRALNVCDTPFEAPQVSALALQNTRIFGDRAAALSEGVGVVRRERDEAVHRRECEEGQA